MCHYTVTAKDELPEIVETYPFAVVCNTHNADQPGEHWVVMYVDEVGRTSTATRRVRELYERTLPQSGQLSSVHIYRLWSILRRFLTLRCRNVSMHAFSGLFTTDLVANDCLVFDLVGKLNRK